MKTTRLFDALWMILSTVRACRVDASDEVLAAELADLPRLLTSLRARVTEASASLRATDLDDVPEASGLTGIEHERLLRRAMLLDRAALAMSWIVDVAGRGNPEEVERHAVQVLDLLVPMPTGFNFFEDVLADARVLAAHAEDLPEDALRRKAGQLGASVQVFREIANSLTARPPWITYPIDGSVMRDLLDARVILHVTSTDFVRLDQPPPSNGEFVPLGLNVLAERLGSGTGEFSAMPATIREDFATLCHRYADAILGADKEGLNLRPWARFLLAFLHSFDLAGLPSFARTHGLTRAEDIERVLRELVDVCRWEFDHALAIRSAVRKQREGALGVRFDGFWSVRPADEERL